MRDVAMKADAQGGAQRTGIPEDLQKIMAAWKALPQDFRQALVALVATKAPPVSTRSKEEGPRRSCNT